MSQELSKASQLINDESQVSSGFVLMHRGVRDHWIWDAPHSPYQAFSDLIFSANWCDITANVDGKLRTISRGQLIVSEVKLGQSWKWSRGKVARLFKLLIQDKMIEVERLSKGSLVTILNYEKYQSRTADGQVTGQQTGHHPKHQLEHQSSTSKELKEFKELNNTPPLPPKGNLVKTDVDLQEILVNHISLNTPNIRELLLAWISGPRKAKRAPLTKLTLEGIAKEYSDSPNLLIADLQTCLENGWQGLKWAKERRENLQNSSSATTNFYQKRAANGHTIEQQKSDFESRVERTAKMLEQSLKMEGRR